jgi:transposase-like protein
MEPEREQKVMYRYSQSFKQKVVDEIEQGKITMNGARRLYGIRGGAIIQDWIRKFGKLYLLNKVVKVEMKDEVSKLKQVEQEKKELESALAQAHLKLLVYESLIEVAGDHYGVDLKKSFGQQPSSKHETKPGKKGKKRG